MLLDNAKDNTSNELALGDILAFSSDKLKDPFSPNNLPIFFQYIHYIRINKVLTFNGWRNNKH